MKKIIFWKEFTINFALVFGIVYSLFLIPYIFLVNRGNILLLWVWIYLGVLSIYSVAWCIYHFKQDNKKGGRFR